MKKRLASIIILSIVSTLTAMLLISVLNSFFRKPEVFDPPVIQPRKTETKIAQKTSVANRDSGSLKSDDKVLHIIIETQDYLNKPGLKPPKDLKLRYDLLTSYNSSSLITEETKKQVTKIVARLKMLLPKSQRALLKKQTVAPSDTQKIHPDTTTIY